MTVKKRIEVEVFRNDFDTLETQISALIDLLPENTEVEINESLIPYLLDTDDTNCSASEILKKEVTRLHDNNSYHKRTVLAEIETEEAEFINILENTGFVVIQKMDR